MQLSRLLANGERNQYVTRDLDAARDFYADVFDWTLTSQPTGDDEINYLIEGGENGGWGGLMAMPPMMPDAVPAHWGVYFVVTDLDATAGAVASNGGATPGNPFEIPTGRAIVAHDPLGATFTLLQPRQLH